MTENNWWKVENLRNQEKKVLRINNHDEMEEGNGDFGSYRKVLKGESFENTMLASHNDLNPGQKIRFINKLMSIEINDTLDILDVGCGMGFTSYELSKFYKNSNVTGVEISTDAIKYATKKFKNIEFICQGIEPTNPSLGQYDLIFCFEFYPFTRTNSIQTHKDYLNYFLSQLKEHGKLVIHLKWKSDVSIFKNFDKIKNEFNFYSFELHTIPNSKILKFLGNNYFSFAVDKILRFMMRKDHNKSIIISLK